MSKTVNILHVNPVHCCDIIKIAIFILELRMQRTTPYIVNFDQSMYSIDESSGQVLITVFLDEPPSTDITVVVFTTDGSATGKHTTTVILVDSFIVYIGSGQDYNSGRYDITFNVGINNVSFHIPIIDDHIFEQDELFIVCYQIT